MDNYDHISVLGEGTYGVVVKARHKDTGNIVAIKKFKETDEDEQVRKTALREVRILKQLHHDHIVNLLDMFRRKGKLYLVFEYVEQTILQLLEAHPTGLSELEVKQSAYQLFKAVDYCHENNVVHRDIKPENILVGKHGMLKLCDFGFARSLAGHGAKYTDYVATRWYRAPELLVGDTEYGKGVDVWAIGCNIAELSNGVPLFPGESDIDQLFHIVKCFGKLTQRQREAFHTNPIYSGVELPRVAFPQGIDPRFVNTPQSYLLPTLRHCLHGDPAKRLSCQQILHSDFFTGNNFSVLYEEELKQIFDKEYNLVKKKKRRPKEDEGSRPTSRRGEEDPSEALQPHWTELAPQPQTVSPALDFSPPNPLFLRKAFVTPDERLPNVNPLSSTYTNEQTTYLTHGMARQTALFPTLAPLDSSKLSVSLKRKNKNKLPSAWIGMS
eukprot:NODE_1465_length_1496_cov_24.500365_g1387_i0.p1 GENE.NODE_1465_length_1496_cov_24.500365_g1387_i0~~NODE_1465_length_1496_cov_24.500365_g1387_i0.p1  ORF type:complete len:440 (+),score=116.92 NODE_1465_length_1496_cov_24.500365_g1387_i0:89-1408(+)